MNIEKHAITENCGTDLLLLHLLPVSPAGQSKTEEKREAMEEMKADLGNGAEAGLAGLRWGDSPLWDIQAGGWWFRLPNGSKRLTRDRGLTDLIREDQAARRDPQ